MTFGENLQVLRLGHGLSQSEFGEMVGVSQAAISAYERNFREPNFEMCEKLADALNVPLSAVIIPTDKSADEDLVRAVADSLHNDPKRRLLFDLSLRASSSDMDAVLAVMKAIVKEKDD